MMGCYHHRCPSFLSFEVQKGVKVGWINYITSLIESHRLSSFHRVP